MTSTLIVGTDGGGAMTDENPHAAQIHLVSRGKATHYVASDCGNAAT